MLNQMDVIVSRPPAAWDATWRLDPMNGSYDVEHQRDR